MTYVYRFQADTRTSDSLALGSALLQHQHVGILPTSTEVPKVLPLLDPLSSTSMPESWVRGAILIRMNSLIRGHSGVRMELIEKMSELLHASITPVVPLRGSISASGGLFYFLLCSRMYDFIANFFQTYPPSRTLLGL